MKLPVTADPDCSKFVRPRQISEASRSNRFENSKSRFGTMVIRYSDLFLLLKSSWKTVMRLSSVVIIIFTFQFDCLRSSKREEMDDRGGGDGTFVAVRRISQGLHRGSACHSTSGIFLFIVPLEKKQK